MLGLISFAVVAILVLRRSAVLLRTRFLWSFFAFMAFAAAGVLLILIEALAPQWPFRTILVPFAAVGELVGPWIVFALFNDRTASTKENPDVN